MLREEINPFESPQQQEAMFLRPDEEVVQVRFLATQYATITPVDSPISISRCLFWARYRIPMALACILVVMFVVITVIEVNQPRFDFNMYFLILVLCVPILLSSVNDMKASSDLDRPLARWLRFVQRRCQVLTSTWIAEPRFVLQEAMADGEFRPTIKTIIDAGYLGISDNRLFLETTDKSIEIPFEAIEGCDLTVPAGFLPNCLKTGSGVIHLIVQFEGESKDFYLRPGYTRWLVWTQGYQIQDSITLHSQIYEYCLQRNHFRPPKDAVVNATHPSKS